jgi:GNAT superfamily N-acetyltransferase
MVENECTFVICKTPEELKFAQGAEIALLEGLGNNILEHLGDVELGRDIRIFIQDQAGVVVGGLLASCFGGWMYISLMWVEKSRRNLGCGAQLLQLAEAEAVQIGCTHAHVDTYSFEARPFYEKHGFQLFATLDEYPPGHCKYFLQKPLT